MKPPKLQRWIDLLAALLRHHFPVSFEQLIREVPAYGGDQSDDALRRMFERDKDELRGFGIPIESVPSDENKNEIVGYRLRPRDFYLPYLAVRAEDKSATTKARKLDRYGYAGLPTLAFESEELAAVTDAAARVRELGDPLLAEHVDSAMRKLACDLPVDVGAAGSTQRAAAARQGGAGPPRRPGRGARAAEARHLRLPHHGERRLRQPHGRPARPLLPEPALVPGRPDRR